MALADSVPLLAIDRAQGPWLFDVDGKRYFDAISSWWVNLFGHSEPRISAAISEQLARLPHTLLAGCTHSPAVELAERLSLRTQGVLGHCFFASDGASAVEIALKMSAHAWRNQGQTGKTEFVCLHGGYHGETLGALSVTDIAVFKDAYDPLLLRPHLVMSPDARQAGAGETSEQVAQRALVKLEQLLELRAESIAALILEPLVQAAGGMAMYHPAYLRGARALCTQFDVHLIADEIAVGCGRTGSFFAWEQSLEDKQASAEWPDFICLSKGITGGFLPLSLVLSKEDVFQAFWSRETAKGFLHSHSYSGNPLACSAALAVLDHFDDRDVLGDNARQAAILSGHLEPLFLDARLEHPRQMGSIWAFDVRPEYSAPDMGARLRSRALEHGLMIRPIGRTVYLMPPYVLTPELSAWVARELSAAVDEALPASPAYAHRAPSAATA